jgi:hypothetical protein
MIHGVVANTLDEAAAPNFGPTKVRFEQIYENTA